MFKIGCGQSGVQTQKLTRLKNDQMKLTDFSMVKSASLVHGQNDQYGDGTLKLTEFEE